jgi:hypothetical protein
MGAMVTLGILLVSGCAVHIPVTVMKPAQLDIGNVKKVAILDFDFTGSWEFWHEDEEVTFEGIAKKVLVRELGLEGPKAKPPNPRTAYPGRQVTDKLISKLVQNGHYQVIERAALNKILTEHRLNMSGLVDESQATRIGQLLGVDALVLGNGTYAVTDGGDWKEYTKKIKKKAPKSPGDTTMVQVEKEVLTYRVVDVATGQIKASMTNSGGGTGKSEKDKKPDAYASLPDWRPLVDRAANQILNQCLRQLAPYYVSQRREIKKGKTPDLKAGMDYAKRGMMEEAKKAWEMALRDKSNKGLKDRPHAMYNLGVYYELSGDLDQAEEMFESCYRLTRKAEYLDHKARIQRRRKEVERLEQQQQE